MKKLIGKKINSVSINDDEDVLSFDTDQGKVNYCVYGDSWTASWFSDIIGVSALLGGTITGVEKIDMDNYSVVPLSNMDDEIIAYGYKLTSDKGYTDIIFRNSCDLYGGWLSDYKDVLPDNMTMITKDF